MPPRRVWRFIQCFLNVTGIHLRARKLEGKRKKCQSISKIDVFVLKIRPQHGEPELSSDALLPGIRKGVGAVPGGSCMVMISRLKSAVI